jgi:hypothetical protein
MQESYERTMRLHEAHLPHLRDSDARIVEDLKTSSVSITSLQAMGLEGVDALLADAYALVARHSPWTRSFQASGAELIAHDKIIRWGLNDRLLDIAENYLGVPVGYDGINVFFTKADEREAGPRRWHRDAEDRRMLKIALYLNDVDEDGGPLQVLRRRLPDQDRMVRGKFPVLTQEKLETALGDFNPDRDVVSWNPDLRRYCGLVSSRQARERSGSLRGLLQLHEPGAAAAVPMRAKPDFPGADQALGRVHAPASARLPALARLPPARCADRPAGAVVDVRSASRLALSSPLISAIHSMRWDRWALFLPEGNRSHPGKCRRTGRPGSL